MHGDCPSEKLRKTPQAPTLSAHPAPSLPLPLLLLLLPAQVAAVTAESCDTVEGIANMGVAMKYVQPTQVGKVLHATLLSYAVIWHGLRPAENRHNDLLHLDTTLLS